MNGPQPSPEMAAVLARLAVEDAGLPDPTTLPASEGRAQAATANERWNVDLPTLASVRNVDVAGPAGPLRCRILVPEGPARGTILFIHGGGWSFCDIDTHERSARLLAIEARATVVSCSYRLAPEHPYPDGLQDCLTVWSALTANAAPFDGLRGPLAVAGDSAGANLAAALMLSEGVAQPDCALLFYGVFDTDFESPSYRECAEGPGLTRTKMQRYWNWYAPQGQRDDPRVAPLRASDADLRRLPPLYLNAAEIDPLRSDSERLFERLAALGRHDEFLLHPGVVHGFMQMTTVLDEARQAHAEAGAAFRRMTNA
ncbi:alpha/beta hydrolase [Algicella marina]|uniref:Alpha/beta hydrolase fold domain-containing protein n=1 Tax=Algicella marina TaxID=2683284 RepID=A0A6P1SYL7_9RHOB|nr:alpha/beta hydrolase [Algicella marina]QHQ34306.1 alpha/beta hydrolase fold domain-containing protein [Algicella marina]